MESLVRSSTWMASAADWAPIRALVLSTLPWTGAAEGPVERAILSLENTNLDTRKAFLSVGVDDVPTALIAQFVGWVKRDRFDSADQSIDYLTALRQVKTPVLVIAGKIDGLAPPWVVRPAYDMLGSPEKQWLVLGEANGQSADYNHMDMLLGEHAATDVFPLVASYLGR
jgi:pimeloyl-ACP methyl ester carboxylesterase